MKYVIIRDDDISYFTKPQILAKLYDPLFKEKKPINLSIIPKISANVKIGSRGLYYKREKMAFEPFIPPEFRGCNEEFPINENTEIVDFIKNLENCEVVQHGFTHGLVDGVQEFRIKDEERIQHMATIGREILETCFNSKPSFFVPPWNNASSETLHFLKSTYKGISIARLNPINLPIKFWGKYLKRTLTSENFMFFDKMLIVEHFSPLLSRFNDPAIILEKVQKTIEERNVIVLVNHHWEYFFDWSQLDQNFFGAWQRVVEYLLQKDDLQFLTFSELYSRLRNKV